MPQRSLVELSPEDCFVLLRTERVGRWVYCDADGPVAIPVNFALAGSDIVFRLERDHALAVSEVGVVAFEADHVDIDNQTGWSVVVRGPIATVDLYDVPALLRELEGHPPLPWAGGIHNQWLRIATKTVTGRRLGEPTVPLVI